MASPGLPYQDRKSKEELMSGRDVGDDGGVGPRLGGSRSADPAI